MNRFAEPLTPDEQNAFLLKTQTVLDNYEVDVLERKFNEPKNPQDAFDFNIAIRSIMAGSLSMGHIRDKEVFDHGYSEIGNIMRKIAGIYRASGGKRNRSKRKHTNRKNRKNRYTRR